MKIEFNWPSCVWKKSFNMLKGLQSEGTWLKGQTLKLIIAIVSFGLTYQVRIMNFALTVFKKSTFQKISHSNALGSQFDPDIK